MTCRTWLHFERAPTEMLALDGFPSFRSGGRAFGNWLAALPFDWEVQAELGAICLQLRVTHSRWQPGSPRWTHPRDLAVAACTLMSMLLQEKDRTARCLALYDVCNPLGDPRQRLFEDLDDLVHMAAWACGVGLPGVALHVEDPERAPSTGLSPRSALRIVAGAFEPALRHLGFAETGDDGAVYYTANRAPRHQLRVSTDAYVNRLVFDSPAVDGAPLVPRFALHFTNLDDLQNELSVLATLLPWDILRRRVLAGCAAPLPMIGSLCADDPKFARRAAAGAHVARRVLLLIARLSDEMAELVAANPHASDGVLTVLAKHEACSVRDAVSSNRARRSRS